MRNFDEAQVRSIDEQISKLQQARALLNSRGSATGRGRWPRTMSAAARAENRAGSVVEVGKSESAEEKMIASRLQ